MFHIIKKADIILFICLILIGAALSYLAFSGSSSGDLVVVKVNGEIYGKYSLTKDRTITVNRDGHMNKITIKAVRCKLANLTARIRFVLSKVRFLQLTKILFAYLTES